MSQSRTSEEISRRAVLLHTTGGYTPLLAAVATCCALAAIGMTTRARTPAP
ncbi:hypothetical protein [Micromonospora arborensis]|uniref:hypothetical protein n=1 Tax=Micromonospora arborensis TaxID=2116518 RepID=UPI00142D2DC3|nr:hypothetical protein [Micromonospora arborensis]